MKVITKGKFKFIKAWSFPKDITNFADYLMARHGGSYWDEKKQCWIRNNWTHIFCGESWLGNLRIDIQPKKNVNMISNYKDLVQKLGKNSQQNIILDPPWQINPLERMQISYAVRDLLKINGFAVFNCLWYPWCIGFEARAMWVPMSHFTTYLDLRCWWVLEKISEGKINDNDS